MVIWCGVGALCGLIMKKKWERRHAWGRLGPPVSHLPSSGTSPRCRAPCGAGQEGAGPTQTTAPLCPADAAVPPLAALLAAEWVRVEGPADVTINPLMAGLSVAGSGGSASAAQPAGQQGPPPQPPRQLSLGSVGVAGVLKREERRAAETEQ